MKIGERQVLAIGITGTIGSGKSSAGRMLEEVGVPVIDADKIVRELLASDKEVRKQIEAEFSNVVKIVEDGKKQEIDRKALANIIFADKEAKLKLEKILHPQVNEICKQRRIHILSDNIKIKAIATLVPLLFESKRQCDYDQVWTIYCDEKILRQRLAKRDGLSNVEIDLRLSGQFTQTEKCKLADKVLDNSSDENHLRQQILKNLQDLNSSFANFNNNLKG